MHPFFQVDYWTECAGNYGDQSHVVPVFGCGASWEHEALGLMSTTPAALITV